MSNSDKNRRAVLAGINSVSTSALLLPNLVSAKKSKKKKRKKGRKKKTKNKNSTGNTAESLEKLQFWINKHGNIVDAQTSIVGSGKNKRHKVKYEFEDGSHKILFFKALQQDTISVKIANEQAVIKIDEGLKNEHRRKMSSTIDRLNADLTASINSKYEGVSK